MAGQGRRGAARVAVVTGGSAGIGLATAQLLAQRGWSVAILARGADRLAEAEALLAREGGRVLAIPADVADDAAVEAAADRIEQELGPIRAWINNAMTTIVGPAERITPEEYRSVTGATYLGTVHGTLAALRRMKPRDRGVIVQVSSGLAIRAAPMQAPYCAAKFAVSGFTDSLRAELIHADSHIALSVVYLPAVNTPQFGWTRTRTGRGQRAPDPVFDPRLCAEAIHHAIEHPTREVWVGRTSLMMAAAQALLPSYADRKAAESLDDMVQDGPVPDRRGNLDGPVPGPARIDGDARARAKTTRSEFWTSRERDALVLSVAGAALLGTALAARALRGPLRLLGRV
ncbi:SDR family NAD(P)-dependent oxidoreductase [Methylorubrum sp. Q1]|uniref:SDR family oxidoreductase n=1 Tax=Methylorubrum sp. Q1 TaxID=2562453 RepID=UPI0010763516|nr:SDR family oxidoreductase [Methylorubrum sp. Q1]TFZ59360.1 SDR family NAD(P)-dependent oxidoreductase [Methylorubrum sp. Q1]